MRLATKQQFLVLILAVVLSWPIVLFSQQSLFVEVSANLGIQHSYQHSKLWGGGVSFFDYNMDGRADLTFSNGIGQQLRIFENNDSGVFLEMTTQMSLTVQVETKSVLWADYDNDGDQDLLVTGYYEITRLFRQDGPMVFTDMTGISGITIDSLQMAPGCWFDYDNDGWLDLYVCNRNILEPNRLYKNNAGQNFVDVTHVAGVGDTAKAPLAVAALDYDNDGFQDIYIANDRGAGNTLYRNLGNGKFADVSAAANADLKFDAMGVAIGDYDNDGWFDIYVSNGPAGNGLLHNNGDGTFSDLAAPLGLLVNKICWGVNFFDYDNDSDLDLLACVSGGSSDISNVLFENSGNGTFLTPQLTGFENYQRPSFSQAIGDFDNDGYPDIVVLNEDSLSTIWHNRGGSNNWLKVELIGTISNRDGVGSIVEIWRSGQKMVRSKHCGISYLGQDDRIISIGVGNDTKVDSIIIRWPSGIVDIARNEGVNKVVSFVEGQAVLAVRSPFVVSGGFNLTGNFPNPFNPQTSIKFTVTRPGIGSLAVFDLHGRSVYTSHEAFYAAGAHQIIWDGTNSAGNPVSSGAYYYQLSIEGFSQPGKMLLIR